MTETQLDHIQALLKTAGYVRVEDSTGDKTIARDETVFVNVVNPAFRVRLHTPAPTATPAFALPMTVEERRPDQNAKRDGWTVVDRVFSSHVHEYIVHSMSEKDQNSLAHARIQNLVTAVEDLRAQGYRVTAPQKGDVGVSLTRQSGDPRQPLAPYTRVDHAVVNPISGNVAQTFRPVRAHPWHPVGESAPHGNTGKKRPMMPTPTF